ncbi:hypothetical protein GOZ89_15525 [Agrobacterium vitis]|uniref:hypothetical protein n=1 Tax=Agrobacterium vitis TaxID=373 RepID=UPI0012E945AC|nr:hypothetical protein [Agrobacterium vitis]MVA80834.1 hypothetical protein [Agrobacterium vitis]
MLFGQSIFQSVVERLSNEEAEKAELEGETNHYRVSGLNTGFVQENSDVPQAAAAWAQEQYLELMPDEEAVSEVDLAKEEVSPPEMPAYLARLAPEEVAEDLGIADNDEASSLKAKRRAFAQLNHPDLVHPLFAEAAHTRMTIANQLIDQALKARS